MSCQRCGGLLAAELAAALDRLVCSMAVIESRHCHCDDVEGLVQSTLQWKGKGAHAGESPTTTTSEGRIL